MSRPWIAFYVGDYDRDTGHLTTLEHGAYFLLLKHYWATEKPLKEAWLPQIAKMSPKRFQKIRESLAKLFYVIDDDWYHKRVERELQASVVKKEYYKQLSAKGVAGRSRTVNRTVDQLVNHARASTTTTSIERKKESRANALEFQQFWDCYGHKVDRPRAEKALANALRKASLEEILAGVHSYRAGLSDLKFIKDPAAWLNGERWADQPARPGQMNGHQAPIEKLSAAQYHFNEEGTPQWNAWDKYSRKTKGIALSTICQRETLKRGRYFPTEWPPSESSPN